MHSVKYRLCVDRVFGCDDCQLVCPWNKYAKFSKETDFTPRHQLKHAQLVSLFEWNEQTFLQKTEGSAIRRAGYQGWVRNLAIGLGNSGYSSYIANLQQKKQQADLSDMVKEHIQWAINQLS